MLTLSKPSSDPPHQRNEEIEGRRRVNIITSVVGPSQLYADQFLLFLYPHQPRYAVTYILQDGSKKTVYAKDGWNLLDLAHSNNIDLEGACEASLACSTCHVIMERPFYDKLAEPTDEENDMLDLAFGLTETSRLGCQVEMCKELDGMTIRIPSASRNIKNENMKK
ncbi:ferredoxin [Rhizoclosmatium globosum]|uniref:Ferredoxin n=1 Tax=Rhizoclosmatium globosum TaxID=329046 RepID=A0A1Y2D3I8_9FUNG|nr:ferredoxin [Rhizoclosmatium globosum]|eukprot:ORY53859.1 ferredoxin [Rhizoclosmatium globosum]